MGACCHGNVVKNQEQDTQQLKTELLINPLENINETSNQEQIPEEIDSKTTKLHNNQLEIKQVQSEYLGDDEQNLQYQNMLLSYKKESKCYDIKNFNSEKKMVTIKELLIESTQQLTNPDLQNKNKSPQKQQINHDFIQSNVRQLVLQQKQIKQ